MTTYTINKSDGTTLTTVPEATINSSACSISLIGRRASNYGESINENMVKMLENFASEDAPASPLTGQFWFDLGTSTLKIYFEDGWQTLFTVSEDGNIVTAHQFISTAATGDPPLIVASTTLVENLNADYLDGYSADVNATPNTIPIRDGDADIYANLFQGTATAAQYADVAERFKASEPLVPGDVVELSEGEDGEIEKAREFGGSAFGVISTSPAIRMNILAGDDESHPFVAFTGRVPCRVAGPVKKGERLMVSAVEGVACAFDRSSDHFVIGRALENKTDDGIGVIEIVVGVK